MWLEKNLGTLNKLITRCVREHASIQHGLKKPSRTEICLNVGDAQSLGQSPMTFLRQVMSLVVYPALMSHKTFPEDAKQRAKQILEGCSGKSIGSYSSVCGMEIVRRQIARFIEKEDDTESNWENIYIGQGAGDMARNFMSMINMEDSGMKTGILNPVPQNPFYSATMTELGLQKIDYYMDEDHQWNINIDELQRKVDEAKTRCKPRAIIVINPGNPTGHILKRKNIEEIVKFAFKENLIIIADEVYRTSILKKECVFVPFRRVLRDLGQPYNEMELVTLMSMSEGIYAENGSRCGYAEIINMSPEIPPMIHRFLSISPPACNSAQAALYCVVNPPKPGEPSYGRFEKEKRTILSGLQMSALIVKNSTRFLEGLTCNQLEGGIFFYPRIIVPQRAVRKADELGLAPDEFYALKLLGETGICVLPGSKLGQKPGTSHIRITLLSNPEEIQEIMESFGKFHFEFMRTFSG